MGHIDGCSYVKRSLASNTSLSPTRVVSLSSLLCYITKGYGTIWPLLLLSLGLTLVFLCFNSGPCIYYRIDVFVCDEINYFSCENMYNGTVNHQGYSWAKVVTFKWAQFRAVSKAMSCP